MEGRLLGASRSLGDRGESNDGQHFDDFHLAFRRFSADKREPLSHSSRLELLRSVSRCFPSARVEGAQETLRRTKRFLLVNGLPAKMATIGEQNCRLL